MRDHRNEVLFVLLCGALLFCVGFFGAQLVARHYSSSVLCETFNRPAQPGLFETFQGRVCSDNPAVKAIARNYGECVKSGATEAVCSNEQLGYFTSSGAYPDDAAKALALVLKAYHS